VRSAVASYRFLLPNQKILNWKEILVRFWHNANIEIVAMNPMVIQARELPVHVTTRRRSFFLLWQSGRQQGRVRRSVMHPICVLALLGVLVIRA